MAAAAEAARKAAAEAEAKRAEEERRRIASREEAKPSDDAGPPQSRGECEERCDREALTRSLQTALNRVGCYRGEIDGQWGTQGRTALAQFAKLTKHELAVDEPSLTALEVVVARTERVCPLECDGDKIERNGKCVPKASKAKNSKRARARTRVLLREQSRGPSGNPRKHQANPPTTPRAAAGAGAAVAGVDVDAAGWAKQSDRAANRALENV